MKEKKKKIHEGASGTKKSEGKTQVGLGLRRRRN